MFIYFVIFKNSKISGFIIQCRLVNKIRYFSDK
jgi:hypothetical protein